MDPDFVWTNYRQKLRVVGFWWNEQRGICHLCHDPELLMDPYRRRHDENPLAASIEHLIPKRDNGPNSVRNARLAHRMCNGALGALFSHNRHRVTAGETPIPESVALAAVREQYAELIADRLANNPPVFVLNAGVAYDFSVNPAARIKWSMADTRTPGMSLPRGATLPGYQPPPDAPIPRVAPRPRDLLERKGGQKVNRPVCQACGSHEVTRDASLRWDSFAGWVIAEHRDGYECRRCDADTAVRWEFVNQGVPG